jgi:hypothetical protein
MEIIMLRKLLLAAAALGTLGLIVTPALVTHQALAEAPKCKNKANKYVACTDKLKAKAPRRASHVDGRDFLVWQRGNRPSASKPRASR